MRKKVEGFTESFTKTFPKLTLNFSIIFILLIIAIILGIVNDWSKEEYCSAKTYQALGGNYNKVTGATEEEMRDIPYLRSSTDKNGNVFLGTKEELICESNYKFLGIF